RYDRIIFVVIILVVLVLMLSSCISSCGNQRDDPNTLDTSSTNPLEDERETIQTDSNIPGGSSTPSVSTGYATISKDSDDIHTGDMILVNSKHACVFDTAQIEAGTSADISFVTIKSILDTKESPKHYTASDWEVGLDRTAAYAMDAWFEGFYDATNNRDLRMIRGYNAESEDPDFRTGRTLTVGIYPESGSSNFYSAEGEYAWLAEHAAEYGFVQRYPEGKESYFGDNITSRTGATFRYVGVAAATYMTENDLCLEEFLEEIKTHSIDTMLTVKSGAAEYGIYYVVANTSSSTTSFSVPSGDLTYTISGNNIDGFIVTAAMNAAASVTTKTTPDYEDLDE
ncbi:MAG: hypothetical protein K2I93_01235, partial [Oscillospiraceae bacterium]|nr:hypothetical protein [Oscillospiraceae bacterium]